MSNGFSPKSKVLRALFAFALRPSEPNEQVIIHHVTDTTGGAQFEVERRSKVFGIRFERVRM